MRETVNKTNHHNKYNGSECSVRNKQSDVRVVGKEVNTLTGWLGEASLRRGS